MKTAKRVRGRSSKTLYRVNGRDYYRNYDDITRNLWIPVEDGDGLYIENDDDAYGIGYQVSDGSPLERELESAFRRDMHNRVRKSPRRNPRRRKTKYRKNFKKYSKRRRSVRRKRSRK